MLPTARQRSSIVLAPMRLRCAFSFEKAISIELRSALYGGRMRSQAPRCLRIALAFSLLWLGRLSRITTS